MLLRLSKIAAFPLALSTEERFDFNRNNTCKDVSLQPAESSYSSDN